MGNFVITIGRECGSGGRTIAKMLAERLQGNCYDKELLLLASENSGLCQEILEHHDERPTNSFLYSLVMDTYSIGHSAAGYMEMPLNQKAFLAQFDTIKKLADRECCIIVGRCADYALENRANVLSVFFTANYADKVDYVSEHYHIADNKLKDFITKTDKKRASYYNYYTNKKWGVASSYDLCINTSAIGYECAVELILEALEKKKAFKA